MKKQIETARRREVILPAILIAAAFVIFFAGIVWVGFAHPAALGRLSDSLATLFFVITTVILLIGFVLNTLIIAKIAELRDTLPVKLDAANDKVRETEPIILESLNHLAGPLIGLIANFNATLRIFSDGKARGTNKNEPSSEK